LTIGNYGEKRGRELKRNYIKERKKLTYLEHVIEQGGRRKKKKGIIV